MSVIAERVSRLGWDRTLDLAYEKDGRLTPEEETVRDAVLGELLEAVPGPWAVLSTGCLECGGGIEPEGVYGSLEAAKAATGLPGSVRWEQRGGAGLAGMEQANVEWFLFPVWRLPEWRGAA